MASELDLEYEQLMRARHAAGRQQMYLNEAYSYKPAAGQSGHDEANANYNIVDQKVDAAAEALGKFLQNNPNYKPKRT